MLTCDDLFDVTPVSGDGPQIRAIWEGKKTNRSQYKLGQQRYWTKEKTFHNSQCKIIGVGVNIGPIVTTP